jgi:rubrerythrin
LPDKIFELLLKHENELVAFYSLCLASYPEYNDEWKLLIDEEKRHAQIIEKLIEKVDNQTVYLQENRFKERPVEISLEYIRDSGRRIEAGEINLLSVLSIAYSIEDSYIEKSYYEIFTGPSENLNRFLKQLHEETINHRELIKKMLERERKKIR